MRLLSDGDVQGIALRQSGSADSAAQDDGLAEETDGITVSQVLLVPFFRVPDRGSVNPSPLGDGSSDGGV